LSRATQVISSKAALILGVERQTVERFIERGKLKASKVGRRVVIQLAEIRRHLADNAVTP
jgi:excisionase family DNA binding protein